MARKNFLRNLIEKVAKAFTPIAGPQKVRRAPSPTNKRQYNRTLKELNKELNTLVKKYDKLTLLVDGKESTTTVGQIRATKRPRREYQKDYESFKDDNERQSYIQKVWDRIENFPRRTEEWRQNFIDGLDRTFGELADALIAKIESISIDEFAEIMYRNNILISFYASDDEDFANLIYLESVFNVDGGYTIEDFG